MKRVSKFVLMSLLLFSLLFGQGLNLGFNTSALSLFGENIALASETKVTTTALNLRSGPGTGYSILLTMPKGSSLTVLSTTNDWSKVTYQGTTGYAYAPYLASPGTSEAVVTYGVNFRTGPGTGYAIIQFLPKGTRVSQVSLTKPWAKVSYGGKTGYVWAAYIAASNGNPGSTTYYTTGSLNLRSGAGTNYSILLTMPRGSSVAVSSIANDWAKVSYKGTSGYAYAPYLSTSPPLPEPTSSLKKIYTGITSSTKKRMAITFDDGATTAQVDQVLTILDRYHAKSTFFFTGEWIQSHPTSAKKIVSLGHKMESHTVSHPFLTTLSDDAVRLQLTRSRAIIKDTVGTTSYLIRPPYGDTNSRVQRIAQESGYKYMVMWSIDTDDYKSASTAASITRKAIAGASNNGILLLHPAHQRVIDALPSILSQLRDKGYSFTTVNEMLP